MSFLVLRALLKLAYFDLLLKRGNFAWFCGRVRTFPLGESIPLPHAMERICGAVDIACIWYWKQVLCLQRSAATACLLKQYGLPARMMIGVQQMPFKAHAWVEIDGRVANDKSYVRDIYTVLDSI